MMTRKMLEQKAKAITQSTCHQIRFQSNGFGVNTKYTLWIDGVQVVRGSRIHVVCAFLDGMLYGLTHGRKP